MASLPCRLVLLCGLILLLSEPTSSIYLVNMTGNCTNGFYQDVYYKPFRIWSESPRTTSIHCVQYTDCNSDNIVPNQVNFMGKPESMDAKPYLTKYPNGKSYPGINVTWTPPFHAAGIRDLKGFFLAMNPIVGATREICRVFDFSQNNFTAADVRLTFNKEIFGVIGGTDVIYMVSVYTLPTSEDDAQRSLLSRYQFVHPQGRSVSSAYNWAASMTYDNSTPGEVKAGFGLAPPELMFEEYTLEIVKRGDKNVFLSTIIRKSDLTNKQWASWTFKKIPRGFWRVRVQPKDHYHADDTKCLCYEKILEPTNFGRRLCRPCMITQTNEFFVEGNPPTTTPIPREEKTSSQETKSTTNPVVVEVGTKGTTSDTGKIIGAVIGTILGVALLAIVAFFFWKKRKDTSENKRNINNNNNNDITNKPSEYENQAIYSVIPGLSWKTIFIVCAEDHSYHKRAVEKFATYLQTLCKCKVIYAPWQANQIRLQGNGTLWAITNIDKSSYTIIINSEAAFKLFEAVKDADRRTAYKNPDASPEGDLFTPSIKYVISKLGQPDSSNRFIMVSFEHTEDEHIISEINPGFHYKLPKHLPHLLCHIHQLETQNTTISLRANNLPYQDNIAYTPEGAKLIEAIYSAANFQKTNPKWFRDRFVRMDSGFESAGCGSVPSSPMDFRKDFSSTNVPLPARVYDNVELPTRQQYRLYPSSDEPIPQPEMLEFIAPEDIDTLDGNSMTMSDQFAEVNMLSDFQIQHTVLEDCVSIGGQSV